MVSLVFSVVLTTACADVTVVVVPFRYTFPPVGVTTILEIW